MNVAIWAKKPFVVSKRSKLQTYRSKTAPETALKLEFVSLELVWQGQGGTGVVWGLSGWSGDQKEEKKIFRGLRKISQVPKFF